MRTRRFAAVLALLLASACIKRVNPPPGAERSGFSGVPLAFGQPLEVPEGSKITWTFGDGAVAEGAQVSHAFPRAGAFTVTQTVTDKDGQRRTADSRVTVLRRGVASAIPADARAALVMERPWARAKVHREVARRIGLGELYDDYMRSLQDALGFDFTDGAQADANGIDPDEGVALYTVPQDGEALVALAGITDSARAQAALGKLLQRKAHGEAFALSEAKLPDGTPVTVGTRLHGTERVGWLERHGYLYLRTPGPTDPLLALASAAALAPDAGLEKQPAWNEALQRVGAGDAVFWSAQARAEADAFRPGGRFSGELGATAFSVAVEAEQVRFTLFAQLRSLAGQQLVAALTPAGAPPDLASQLPAGAAVFLKLSGAPPAVWRELSRAAQTDGPAVRDRLREWLGADVEKEILPAFTGNGVVAIYLDANSLLEALLGEQVAAWDRSTFLFASELIPGKEAALRASLDRVSRPEGGPRAVRGATFWRLSEGLQVAVRGNTLFAALGGAPEVDPEGPGSKAVAAAGKAKAPAPKKAPKPPPEPTAAELGPLAGVLLRPADGATLGKALAAAAVPGLDQPQHQVGWVDLAGTLRALDAAAERQGGMVSAGIALLTGRARGLRDLVVDAVPSEAGLTAQARLRLKPPGPTASAPAGGAGGAGGR